MFLLKIWLFLLKSYPNYLLYSLTLYSEVGVWRCILFVNHAFLLIKIQKFLFPESALYTQSFITSPKFMNQPSVKCRSLVCVCLCADKQNICAVAMNGTDLELVSSSCLGKFFGDDSRTSLCNLKLSVLQFALNRIKTLFMRPENSTDA